MFVFDGLKFAPWGLGASGGPDELAPACLGVVGDEVTFRREGGG